MNALMTRLAPDFEQRMQQLDALQNTTPCAAPYSNWPATDIQHIKQELATAQKNHHQHINTYRPDCIKQFERLQTFTMREIFLKTVGLISEEEQSALREVRYANATEALSLGEHQETRLREIEDMWQTRLNKLQTFLG